MEIVGQVILLSLLVGSVYGLVAVGLSLVYGVMRIVNIAHGEFVMLGAYVTFFAWSLLGIHPLLSIPVSAGLLFALGAAVHFLLVERVIGKSLLSSLMLTFGLSAIIWNSAQAVFTTQYRGLTYLTEPIPVFGIHVGVGYLVGGVITTALVGGLFLLLKLTDWGRAIRATAQNPEVAQACGIDTRRVRLLTFAVGAALAGVAGSIVSIVLFIYPTMGGNYLLRAFAIVVLGGLGNVLGSLVGALLYALAETAGAQFVSSQASQLLPFLLLLAFLLLRPRGLWGGGE